ncbi:MAG: energy-coupling factor transporter ATPase [Bacillota bacterium]|nr:energy-coupling factor transporter ATPase [Bacillota bacterium]
MNDIIEIRDLVLEYGQGEEEEAIRAVDGVSLSIPRGGFTAIIGRNGSGKSTLAKCINALLLPGSGVVYVDGMDTADGDLLWEIRQTAGMVFQNPDNQLVSSIVEDDVAFGPENLGIEPEEIRRRVDRSLREVNMYEERKKAPHLLSGGQKQRVAIAGVVAMRPSCIVLDEPTAMLDPYGRGEVMEIVEQLNKEGVTIVLITHFMEEAARADKVVIMDRGRVAMEGTPEEIFSRAEELRAMDLDVPFAVELAERLRRQGVPVPGEIVETEALVEYLCQYK